MKTERLKTIFFPATPAKGRANAKPWRIAVGPDRPFSYAVFEVKPGIAAMDGCDIWALIDVMVRDFNALRTQDGQVEDCARQMRESFGPADAAPAGDAQ